MLDAKLFGIREICDVVLRAKAPQKIGSRIFYTNEPVLYFDTLKTSTFEGAATTVYAQGGRGNARLVAWDGERTVTFTMEDALISPAGLSILTGAGLINANENTTIYVHTTDQLQLNKKGAIGELINPGDCTYNASTKTLQVKLKDAPASKNENEDYIYAMVLDSRGDINTEPFIGHVVEDYTDIVEIKIFDKGADGEWRADPYDPIDFAEYIKENSVLLMDYYVARTSNTLQMNITPDKFGGTFYLEASTLWRDEATGQDLPAEFIIPKCKIQSNFTFNMSSSGDPSTFTFTMDALPDYTRFDKTEKVLASIQILGATDDDSELHRINTMSQDVANESGEVVRPGASQGKYLVINKDYIELAAGDTTGITIPVLANGTVGDTPTVTGNILADYDDGVLTITAGTAAAGTYGTVTCALTDTGFTDVKDSVFVLVKAAT